MNNKTRIHLVPKIFARSKFDCSKYCPFWTQKVQLQIKWSNINYIAFHAASFGVFFFYKAMGRKVWLFITLNPLNFRALCVSLLSIFFQIYLKQFFVPTRYGFVQNFKRYILITRSFSIKRIIEEKYSRYREANLFWDTR